MSPDMNSVHSAFICLPFQLVPFEAQVNFNEFRSVIESKGRYLEWHNKHKHNHNAHAHDKHNQHPDTIVHVDEFRELVIEGLEISKTQYIPVKRGLTGGYKHKHKKDEL